MITFDVQFNLDGLSENVADMADKVQRKAALELFGELLQTTPIDTGRARAGWSMDVRQGSDVPPKNQQTYSPKIPSVPQKAQFIVLYNNVEYIVRLNEGHSQQAPARFVQLAISKVQRGFV